MSPITGTVGCCARAASGREVAVLRGHDGAVNSAAFSPNGARIVTASADKTPRIWDAHVQAMSTQVLVAQACAQLAGISKLTRDEMRLAGYSDGTPSSNACES